jgi:hypothetical protein
MPDARSLIHGSVRVGQNVPVTELVVDVAGWIGMALLIGAYALVTAGRLAGPSLTFQVMNLVGGGLLMVNSGWYGAWPSAALNLVWVVIGTVGLVRAGLRRRTASRSGEGLPPGPMRDLGAVAPGPGVDGGGDPPIRDGDVHH